MEDNKAPNNVIQFPGNKKKETEVAPERPAASTPAVATAKKPVKPKKAKAVTAGSVLAIMLMTGAVNRYAFNNKTESLDASSFSNVSRTIASVERVNWERDANWEKELAESLASTQVRTVASIGIGHAATSEEKLRWGTLEEKYTIVYKGAAHSIETITLQDAASKPAYILDRNQFLRDYGPLFQDGFGSAKLKSVEVSSDKTVEAYTLFDKDKRPKGEAHFELDLHKRLLSFKVAPTQI